MENLNMPVVNSVENDDETIKRLKQTTENIKKLSYLSQIRADSYVLGLLTAEQKQMIIPRV